MNEPVVNPEVPYVGEIEGGLSPGKMVKVQGKVPEKAVRFAVNYQLGPILNPRDDVAIHIAPRFTEGFITRNNIQSMAWGPEENDGPLWIQPGTNFEIIILCEYHCYKIAVNGRHFTEFRHRVPYQNVTHLVIDGDVEIHSIFYEMIPVGPPPAINSEAPEINVGPPPPGGIYPTLQPQGPTPNAGGYNNVPRSYDSNQEKDDVGGDCLDKVGLALGGLVAAGGVAAAMHAYNKNKNRGDEPEHEKSEASRSESGFGGLGALGAALASSLAANSHAQQGYPPQQGGMLGSILGALGGGGSSQPSYHQQQPSDPFSGALGSFLGGGNASNILGNILGGGNSGNHQQPYQPSGGYGGYPPSGGYSQPQESHGNDFLKEIGGAFFKSALDGLSKNKSHEKNDHHPMQQPNYEQYNNYQPSQPQSHSPQPTSGGSKLTAEEISKGLGLGDD